MASQLPVDTDITDPGSLRGLVRQLGLGTLGGTALFLWAHQFLATFGVSTPVTTAMTLSLVIGLVVGIVALAQQHLRHWNRPASLLLMAVWTVAFPTLLSVGRWCLSLVSVSTLTSEATTFCLMLIIAGSLLVLPLAALMVLAGLGGTTRSQLTPTISTTFLMGSAFGLTAGPAIVAPFFSLDWVMLVVTFALAATFWQTLNAAMATPAESAQNAPAIRTHPPISFWTVGLALIVGLLLPIVARLVQRLMPGSPFEHFAMWSGLVFGIAVGVWWQRRVSSRSSESNSLDPVLTSAAIVAVWPLCLLAMWPLLVDGILSVNSSVSFVPAIMLVRISLAAMAVLPLGGMLGRMFAESTADEQTLSVGVLAVGVGIVLTSSIAAPPVVVLSILALSSVGLMAARYWSLGLPSLGRRGQLAGVVATLSVAMLPLTSGQYRPEMAAQLLFSTQTFSALNSGIDRDLLPHLDDSRLLAVADNGPSTWTLWKYRGAQLSLRQNGLPRGSVSTRPESCPQFAGEIMPAVVPLVLHERPHSILMLGLGSPATLSSLLACPVIKIECVEPDTSLIALVDDIIAPAVGANPLEDDRVTLSVADPTLAIQAAGEAVDVILVNEAQPSILSATSTFTHEFYAAARRRLQADGLLCQRLQYADFGREPLEDMLATMRSVFPTVAMFDASPGEMLVIATAKPGPLVDKETVQRCEADHIRRLMAQTGWDWSVLMNLGAIDPDEVVAVTETLGTANTITNGRFAYRLPQEVMRWSAPNLPKWQERQQLLSAHATRMLAWVDDVDLVKQIDQRLADVIEQQRLIVEHPDHFWAYRKTLKSRLIERPRPVIQQVKHEGLKRSLHPEDKRRKDYLEVLGEAATELAPPADDIRELTDFAVPYDPLVSYFLHQEAARLYEKSPSDDPAARLHHWRYSIYFGPPGDRSVRNVVAALKVINDNPELIADPEARWDEMNSLLEILKQRSSLRLRTDNTASTFELVDAEQSINIAKRTMTAMDTLLPQTEVSEGDWQQRKRVLQRMLVRPMWEYHSQQAARLAKLQAQGKLTSAENDDETETR